MGNRKLEKLTLKGDYHKLQESKESQTNTVQNKGILNGIGAYPAKYKYIG